MRTWTSPPLERFEGTFLRLGACACQWRCRDLLGEGSPGLDGLKNIDRRWSLPRIHLGRLVFVPLPVTGWFRSMRKSGAHPTSAIGSCRVEPISTTILCRWLWSMRKSIPARGSATGSCRSRDVSTTILIGCWIRTRKSSHPPVSANGSRRRGTVSTTVLLLGGIPGLLSLLREGISSAPPAAARPRQALFGHLSGE